MKDILPGQLNFPLCLAPMVGLSHVALRLTVREYLPAGARTMWPTEMLNSRRLPDQKVGQTPETFRHIEEEGLVPQILGNEEFPISQSVKLLHAWGAAAIDINMGCPVQKALRHNYGVALMGDADYAAKVVEMTKRNSPIPISVKLRGVPESNFDFLLSFADGLYSAGASWLTLHPRTPEQQRKGTADWSQIRRLKERLGKPLIGNGDIQIASDVFAMMEETGCDMVMSGRALAARPWLLWQVGEELGFGPPPGRTGAAPRTPEEEGAEYCRSLLSLVKHAQTYFTPELGLRKVRFHIKMTQVWMLYGHTLIKLSTKAKSLEEMIPMLEEFASKPQEMAARTALLE